MENLKKKAIEILEKKIKISKDFRKQGNTKAANDFYDEAINTCTAYSELFQDYNTFYNIL